MEAVYVALHPEIQNEIGGISEMKDLTKEEILAEVSALRVEYQMMKKKTRELAGRTSRLYIALENLRPDPGRKITVNNGRTIQT